jgi:hypothetical protein
MSTNENGHDDGTPRENRRRLTHGFNRMKRALALQSNKQIDGRTIAGKTLVKWRADLTADLGGDITTAQSQMIDLAVRSKLLLDSIDNWLLTQPTLVNRRKKSVLPVVIQRQQLADGLARYLQALGLHRKQAETDIFSEDD